MYSFILDTLCNYSNLIYYVKDFEVNETLL